MMAAVAALTLLFVMGTDPAVEEVISAYGEPDIYRFSYHQYAGQGTNNFETKMLIIAYQESLESALDSLYQELRALYSQAPELVKYLDESHSAFLEYSRSWAEFNEENVWWDLETGYRSDGTARSYTYSYVLALYRWQKISSYITLLRTQNVWAEGIPDTDMLGLDQIGGYCP
jgi:hypothetical protein